MCIHKRLHPCGLKIDLPPTVPPNAYSCLIHMQIYICRYIYLEIYMHEYMCL